MHGSGDKSVLGDVGRLADRFISTRGAAAVTADVAAPGLKERLDRYDFLVPRDLTDVARDVFDLLASHAVRTDHPRYFGLFNPPALTSAIAGDLVAAAVNPQLAVWSHAPAAAEIERKLVDYFGRLVWAAGPTAGTFTSGGTEANHTALLTALARRHGSWSSAGIRSLPSDPVIYASSESHLAWIKIARSVGLGTDAVRLVAVEDGLRMTRQDLLRAVDAAGGADPVMVVATAGTTSHGSVDDLRGIAEIASGIGAHFHVDAAWAGGGLLHPDVKARLAGIELADSVTIDPHKWLSVPMGSGMYLTRRWEPLERAFSVRTSYMPSASIEHRDAYIHSLQWSRRFIGLKLFMALATEGLPGYRDMIQRQLEIADYLRQALVADDWLVQNETWLPLVCFAPNRASEQQDDVIRAIERHVAQSREAWVSSVTLRGNLVLRACITSFETSKHDVDALVELLSGARDAVRSAMN